MLNTQLLSKIMYVSICITALSACSSEDNDTEQPQVVLAQPPELNQNKVFMGPLAQPSIREIDTFLKNGLYIDSISNSTTDVEAVSNPIGNSAGEGYSQTNTVENGVDEADRIKYDGQFMYVAETSVRFYTPEQKPNIRVLERQQDGTLSALDSLESSADFDRINGLYLLQDSLTMLGSHQDFYHFADIQFLASESSNEKIAITTFDVMNPSQASQVQNVEIEGALLASRRIGDYLYVVSSQRLKMDNLIQGASTQDDKVTNYNRIRFKELNELMPKISVNGQVANITDAENCYIPSEATEADGYSQLLYVTKINLHQLNDIDNLCMSLMMSTIYVSGENMYLVAQSYTSETTHTILHKINLDSFDYTATGSIPGHLGWRSNPLFRFSEHDGVMRIVTSDYSTTSPTHKLYLLEQNGNVLDVLAQLPNDTHPQPIGKPNEDIYAVRFVEDKAYIVTFELIDPLYVIDLANPREPSILGSLEIPGFSSYIHPMENGYLLGVGQDVSVQDLPDLSSQIAPVLVPEGLKISLFDVNDPSAPLELSNILIPDAYTSVEFNYKALSVLNTQGTYQFAMPIEQWGNFEEPVQGSETASSFIASKNSLLMLEADTLDSLPSLKQVKLLETPISPDTYYYSLDDRSIIHGQQIYYLRGNEVYMSTWTDDDEEVFGPF